MKSRLFILISLLLTLSSCFEIIEEMEVGADGTGWYEYTVNLSQSRTALNGITRMDSINGYRIPSRAEIDKAFEELVSTAKGIEGISNAVHAASHENYIFIFSVEFTNVDALNKLIATMRERNKNGLTDMPDIHFSYDTKLKRYVRNGKYPVKEHFLKLKKADKAVFNGATFTSIFRSELEVGTWSNKDIKVSPNKKALMLKCDVLDLINEKVNVGNTIQLKK